MSYVIKLIDQETGQPAEVPCHKEGGIYPQEGGFEAELNITYNYSECYSLCQFNIRDLYGKTAKDTEEKLAQVVDFLGTHQYRNSYWAPTPGNAGHACSILLAWARQHPNAVWEGD